MVNKRTGRYGIKKAVRWLLCGAMIFATLVGISVTGYAEGNTSEAEKLVSASLPVLIQETGEAFDTLGEAIAHAKAGNKDTFTLEVRGDTNEEGVVPIELDVTVVGADGTHTVNNAALSVKNGGSLSLGDGTDTNTLGINGSVSVSNGTLLIEDGVTLSSKGDGVFLTGSGASGIIRGGRIEGKRTALSLEKGAQIIEISGGKFYGTQEAVHITDSGTKIHKISGGSFYQTDSTTKLHGQALFVQNESQIGEISGGHFEAVRSQALIIVRGGRVEKISGGEFVAKSTYDTDGILNAAVRIDSGWSTTTKASIGTVSGGHFIGGHFGMLNISGTSIGAEIDKIVGGTFEATVSFQNDANCVVNEISGGQFRGNQGMLNAGRIGKISGQADIVGKTSYGIFNYAKAEIDEISGGRIVSEKNNAIANAGLIKLISNGTIMGERSAINCDGLNKGRLEKITNGVFLGKTGTAIELAYELILEPGLDVTKGFGRYWGKDGTIFNDEDLVVYPYSEQAEIFYYLSTETATVSGIDGVDFKYLTYGAPDTPPPGGGNEEGNNAEPTRPPVEKENPDKETPRVPDETSRKKDLPGTGDSSTLIIWILLLLGSAALAGWCILTLQARKKEAAPEKADSQN